MRILIDTIPPNAQRYSTVGDWQFTDPHTLEVCVSRMEDPRYEALVGIHEAVEALICQQRGITDDMVTAFDTAFEAARKLAPSDGTAFAFRGRWVSMDAEPGDDPECPYRDAHCIATAVERMLCSALGVSWDAYSIAVEKVLT